MRRAMRCGDSYHTDGMPRAIAAANAARRAPRRARRKAFEREAAHVETREHGGARKRGRAGQHLDRDARRARGGDQRAARVADAGHAGVGHHHDAFGRARSRIAAVALAALCS